MSSVLGRGMDALFNSSEKKKNEKEFLIMLDPRLLKPNPYQPRRTFDNSTLEELSTSIKVHGLIQPVVAQKDIDGSYFIIAGERRTRASIIAGLEKIPVILNFLIKSSTDSCIICFILNLFSFLFSNNSKHFS